MFTTINKWFSEPFSQVIVHPGMVTVREPHVFVRLCLGHSLAIPLAILRPLTPDQERQAEPLQAVGPNVREADVRSMEGQGSVTLRLSEAIDPEEADFLYRLVSVVIQLTATIQKSDPGAKLRMRSPAHHPAPSVRFYLTRAHFRLTEERDKYVVHFGSGFTVMVPASLVNFQEVSEASKQAETNDLGTFQVTFNSASLLAPLLNELVHTISQLLQHFDPLPLQDSP
jgi:hypothetical protein